MIRSFVVLSFLMSASVATAQSTSDSAPASAPDAKPVKEKKICRDSEDTTSRIAKRICRTAKEWSEGRATARPGVRSSQAED